MGLTWILAVIFVGVTAVWWWQNSHLEQDITPVVDVAKVEGITPSTDTIASAATVVSPTVVDTATTTVTDGTPSTASAAITAPVNPDALPAPAVITDVATTTAKPVAATTAKPVAATTATVAETTVSEAVTPAITTDVEAAPALQLTFVADCWIDIRDANGKRLESGIKTSGQTLDINGKAPFRVRLGAPSAVKIELKGQPFDLSRYPAGRPITLTLPQ